MAYSDDDFLSSEEIDNNEIYNPDDITVLDPNGTSSIKSGSSSHAPTSSSSYYSAYEPSLLSSSSSSTPAITMGQNAIIPMQAPTVNYIEAFKGQSSILSDLTSLLRIGSVETPDLKPIRTRLSAIHAGYMPDTTPAATQIKTALHALLSSMPAFTEQVLITKLLDYLWQIPQPVHINLLASVMDVSTEDGLNFDTYFKFLRHFTARWDDILRLVMVQDEHKRITILPASTKAVSEMVSARQIDDHIRQPKNFKGDTRTANDTVVDRLREQQRRRDAIAAQHATMIQIQQCDGFCRAGQYEYALKAIRPLHEFISAICALPYNTFDHYQSIAFESLKLLLPHFLPLDFEQFAESYRGIISHLAQVQDSINKSSSETRGSVTPEERGQLHAKLVKLADAFKAEPWLLLAMDHDQNHKTLKSLVRIVSPEELVQATTAALQSSKPELAQLIVQERYKRHQYRQDYSLFPFLPPFVQKPTLEEMPYVCDFKLWELRHPVTTPDGGKYERDEMYAYIWQRLQQDGKRLYDPLTESRPTLEELAEMPGLEVADPLTGNPHTIKELIIEMPDLKEALAVRRETEKQMRAAAQILASSHSASADSQTEAESPISGSPASYSPTRLSSSPKATTFGNTMNPAGSSTSNTHDVGSAFTPL